MRKIKFVDDGQPSQFDENFGAASAPVSGGASRQPRTKQRLVNLIKKCQLLTISLFHALMV